MNIHELKQILENKLRSLEIQKSIAFNEGDLETVISLDAEIAETKETISKLG